MIDTTVEQLPSLFYRMVDSVGQLQIALRRNRALQEGVAKRLQVLRGSLTSTSEICLVVAAQPAMLLAGSSDDAYDGSNASTRWHRVTRGHALFCHPTAETGVATSPWHCFAGHLEHSQMYSLFSRTSRTALLHVDSRLGRDVPELHLRRAVEDQWTRFDPFALAFLINRCGADGNQGLTEPSPAATTILPTAAQRRVSTTSAFTIAGAPPNSDDTKRMGAISCFPSPFDGAIRTKASSSANGHHGCVQSGQVWCQTLDNLLMRVLVSLLPIDKGRSIPALCNLVSTLSMNDWVDVAMAVSRSHFYHQAVFSTTDPSCGDLLVRFEFNSFAPPITGSCCRHRWAALLLPIAESAAELLRCSPLETSDFIAVIVAAAAGQHGARAWSDRDDTSLHRILLNHEFGYLVCRPVWLKVAEKISIGRQTTDDSARADGLTTRRLKREPIPGSDEESYTAAEMEDTKVAAEAKTPLRTAIIDKLRLRRCPTPFQIASRFQSCINPYHTTTKGSAAWHDDIVQAMKRRVAPHLLAESSSSTKKGGLPKNRRRTSAADSLAELLEQRSVAEPSPSFSVEEDARMLWCANNLSGLSFDGEDTPLSNNNESAPRATDIFVSFFFRTLAVAYSSIPSTGDDVAPDGQSWGPSPFFSPSCVFRTLSQVAHRWPVLAPQRSCEEKLPSVPRPTSHAPLHAVEGLRDALDPWEVHGFTPGLHLLTIPNHRRGAESESLVVPRPIADAERTWNDPSTKFLAMFALCVIRRLQGGGGGAWCLSVRTTTEGEVGGHAYLNANNNEANTSDGLACPPNKGKQPAMVIKKRGDITFVQLYVLENVVPHERLRTMSRYTFSTRLHLLAGLGSLPADTSAEHANTAVSGAPVCPGVQEGYGGVPQDESGDSLPFAQEPRTTATSPMLLHARRSSTTTPPPPPPQQEGGDPSPPAPVLAVTEEQWTEEFDAFLQRVVEWVGVPWCFENDQLLPLADDKNCWWRYVALLMGSYSDAVVQQQAPPLHGAVEDRSGTRGSPGSSRVPSLPTSCSLSRRLDAAQTYFTSPRCYHRFVTLKRPRAPSPPTQSAAPGNPTRPHQRDGTPPPDAAAKVFLPPRVAVGGGRRRGRASPVPPE